MNESMAAKCARSTESRLWSVALRVSLFISVLMATIGQAQVEPVGGETLVNSPTGSSANYPAVALDDLGQFLVVWGSNVDGGDSTDVLARRFDPDGLPVGEEFLVNSLTTDGQRNPVVGQKADGGFVVFWTGDVSSGTDTDSFSIQGRHLAADGTPQGTDFQVNSTTTDAQYRPSLAMHPDGSFLVVWQSFASSGGDDSDGRSVQGQLFDTEGNPTGTEFQVNTYTTSEQSRSKAAALGDGFVVTWQSAGSPGNDDDADSIQARLLDQSGPVGTDFQVNTYTTGSQSQPSAVTGPGNQFVVVWSSDGSPGTDDALGSVQAQRFETDGTPLGGQFQVNTYTTGIQEMASGVLTTAEQILVVWNSGNVFSNGLDGDEGGVSLQTFDRDGNPLGEEFLVNTFTTANQWDQQIATNRQGDAVVVWSSYPDPPNNEILFQRFADPAVKLFEDGFESGDTTAWSSAVGKTDFEGHGKKVKKDW